MCFRRLAPFVSLLLLVGWGCSQKDVDSAPAGPNVVASFNGGVITKEQLMAKFEGLMPCCKARYEGEEGARALVKEMVLPVVVSKAIKGRKIDLRGNIREELGDLTDKLNTSFLHMKFHEQILKDNDQYKDLREMYEHQKRILEGYPLSERYDRLVKVHQKLHHQIAKEVEKVSQDYIRKLRKEAAITKHYDVLEVKVTPAELKDFYRQHHVEGLHGDEYRVPDKVKIREIVIKIDERREDCPSCKAEQKQKAREKAEAALIELRSGADFEVVAGRYVQAGEDPARSRWIEYGVRGQVFDDIVFSADEGEISRVFQQDDAFHIVKVLKKQQGYHKPYEEIIDQLAREYRWQKGEEYLKGNRDRILFAINGKPYTIGDFIDEYTRVTPPHECHHMEGMSGHKEADQPPMLCDFAHNDLQEKKKIVDRMIDKELIVEDTYSQMIHVEHQQEIEFLTMASLYPVFHKEEMEKLIHITDDMVENYYRKNKEAYKYPASAKISMIVVRGGNSKEERARAFEKAKRALEEIKPSVFSFKKGRDFAEVAREYSDDEETASKGGRVEVDVYECRNAVEYMLLHGFHSKIFELKPGDISEIFEFGEDYYIVQIREMESRKEIPLQQIQEDVRRDLWADKHQDVMTKWEDDLLKAQGFVVYEQAVAAALAESRSVESGATKES